MPAYASCSFSPTIIYFNGDNSVQTDTLTISIAGAQHNFSLGLPWLPAILLAAAILFARRRLSVPVTRLLIVLLLVSGSLALSSCASNGGTNSYMTPPGTYSIQINITGAAGSQSVPLTVIVQ